MPHKTELTIAEQIEAQKKWTSSRLKVFLKELDDTSDADQIRVLIYTLHTITEQSHRRLKALGEKLLAA